MKEEHRNNCDHERAFLQEFTEEGKGNWIGSQALYDKYKNWTIENGYYHVSSGKFKDAIKRMYKRAVEAVKRTEAGQVRVICNIKMKSSL